MLPAITPLESLRRQYFSLLPPYLLQLPLPAALASAEAQDYLIEHILYDPHLREREPVASYQKGFWRKVVDLVEQGVEELDDPDLEVDGRLYEALAELMATPTAGPSMPGSSYRTFIYHTPSWSNEPRREARVTLLEELAVIQSGTTGLRTWTASLHLAHHILHDPRLLLPPTAIEQAVPPIIELGAGTGFLSILLAQLGYRVMATDLGDVNGTASEEQKTPLARLEGNIRLNELDHPPEALDLDWSGALKPADERDRLWERLTVSRSTIVAADVIYDPDVVPALVAAIFLLLDPSGSNLAILAATVRNESTLTLFVENCYCRQLLVEMLDLPPMDPGRPTFWDSALEGPYAQVRIMKIRKRPS